MTDAVLDDVTETRERATVLREEIKLLEEALQGFQERRRADARMGLDCRPHALKERQLESDLRGLREELGHLEVRLYQHDIGAGEAKLSECNAALRTELAKVLETIGSSFTLKRAREARWQCEQVDVALTTPRENLRLLAAALASPLASPVNSPVPVRIDEASLEVLHRLERAVSAITAAQQYAATMGIR